MILDNNLAFVSSSAPQSITVSAASTNTVDLTGFGYGTTPNLNFGLGSVYGADMGIGDGVAMPKVVVDVGTSFATSTNATLTIQLQGGQDNGSNAVTNWITYAEIPGLTPTNLTAASNNFSLDLPKVPYSDPFPRFWRLYFSVATGTFTAGTIYYAGIAIQRDDSYATSQYPRNFTVAA
jgi:hypothetical protein